MKHLASFFLSLLTLFAFTSCEKETVLSIDQTSITIPDTGGTQTVSLSANKPWTASSNQSWCKVSPSSGDDASSSRITITCDANTTYDARNASVSFTCAEKIVSVNVSQAINNGLLVSQTEYNITNAAQQLEIPVQANVKFSVEVDNGCKDWVKYNTTKGLTNSTVVLDISKNEAYDGREGIITIKQSDGSLSTTVVVKQSQTNAMFVDQKAYDVSYKEQQVTIKVKSNIDYKVEIDNSCKDWISCVGTKGLTESTITLSIAMNEGEKRQGKVLINSNDIQETIIITQETEGYINLDEFEDERFLQFCLASYDNNKDGKLSLLESRKVYTMSCDNRELVSIKGIRFFTNLEYLDCSYNRLTRVDLSGNNKIKKLYCYYNRITDININKCPYLEVLSCLDNRLSFLDVRNNIYLQELVCNQNALNNLDVSKNTYLKSLHCGYNPLTSLDISNNILIEDFSFWYTQITQLDIRNNLKIKELRCDNNRLSKLLLHNNIVYVNCSHNKLTTLDISGCIQLEALFCYQNQLSNIDISQNVNLIGLYLSGNQLTELNTYNNIWLRNLRLDKNLLTSLDVSNNLYLEELYCQGNPNLKEIWLKEGQYINNFNYNNITTIKYK